jgi:DNA invertase Pin-like site-specific DNA recombinase
LPIALGRCPDFGTTTNGRQHSESGIPPATRFTTPEVKMTRTVAVAACIRTPAAQYVRMSTDDQQYSIANQKQAIGQYADQHGFEIVRTYADVGKSGVVLRQREGLRQLLRDVVGKPEYKAILVLDVSRWGRFQNADESAHYEFLCTSSGIPVHYCAEPFSNDSTPVSSLLKALKRSMAAEFSRELGIKVFEGKSRIAQLGFSVGGKPGYAFRRVLRGANGQVMRTLERGEHKYLTTDRVSLTPNGKEEVDCVRLMFDIASKGTKRCTEIARYLNDRKILKEQKEWDGATIHRILTCPRYAGFSVWNRTSLRLHAKRTRVPPEKWIMRPGAIPQIVDQATFDRVQRVLRRHADRSWSTEEILKKMRRLLAANGRLSEEMIQRSRGGPALSTIKRQLGPIAKVYELIGYQCDPYDYYRGPHQEVAVELRRRLVRRIQHEFPEHVEITRLPGGSRSLLLIDNELLVAILLCPIRYPHDETQMHWVVSPIEAEHELVTLLCKMTPERDRIISSYVFPRIEFKSHRSHRNDPWLTKGRRLASLKEFYGTVKDTQRRRMQEDRDRC